MVVARVCDTWLTVTLCVGETCWCLTLERLRNPSGIDPCLADYPHSQYSLDRLRTRLCVPNPDRPDHASPTLGESTPLSHANKDCLFALTTWCGHLNLWLKLSVNPRSPGRVTIYIYMNFYLMFCELQESWIVTSMRRR